MTKFDKNKLLLKKNKNILKKNRQPRKTAYQNTLKNVLKLIF